MRPADVAVRRTIRGNDLKPGPRRPQPHRQQASTARPVQREIVAEVRRDFVLNLRQLGEVWGVDISGDWEAGEIPRGEAGQRGVQYRDGARMIARPGIEVALVGVAAVTTIDPVTAPLQALLAPTIKAGVAGGVVPNP